MWDFLLVLGQVPGTDIQITFLELLLATALAAAFLLYRKHLLKASTLNHLIHQLLLYLRTKRGQQLKLPL